jgi:hypothetical protein
MIEERRRKHFVLTPLGEKRDDDDDLYGTGLLYGLHIRRTGQNPPRVPSACWWVLTTANAAETTA